MIYNKKITNFKESKNSNQKNEQQISSRKQEEKLASNENSDLKMKKIEREVSMMKKERNDTFERFDKIDQQMKKRFNDVDSRFRILMPCMTSVSIPNEVNQIPYTAFMNCTNLEKVTFTQSLKTIGNSAFLWLLVTQGIELA